MRAKYLSLAEALSRCNDHKHLIGNPFQKENTDSVIQAVLPAPASKIIQWKFLRQLSKGTSWEEAIKLCVNNRYSVLVLPSDFRVRKSEFLVKDLDAYLMEFNVDGIRQEEQR